MKTGYILDSDNKRKITKNSCFDDCLSVSKKMSSKKLTFANQFLIAFIL